MMYDGSDNLNVCKIKVVGVGGAGNNAVNRMIRQNVSSATFYAINTDKQALLISEVPEDNRLQIGYETTKGLGAGSNPEIGEAAAEESKDQIRELIGETDLLFIAAGMGGGTGTGAAPIIARIAKEMGIVTVAVVTKPFSFEGKKREDNAKNGIQNLSKYVDTIIIIPNEKLFEALPSDTSMPEALKFADDTLRQGVCGIADLIATPSMINLDFADVKTILKDQGLAHMGVGMAKGDNRIVDAVRQAVSSPLLETTIEGARGVILNITGGKDLSLGQVKEAATLVGGVIDDSANIIFGANIDPTLQEEVVITLIATGFVNHATMLKSESSAARISRLNDRLQNIDTVLPVDNKREEPKPAPETPEENLDSFEEPDFDADYKGEEQPSESPKVPKFVEILFGSTKKRN